KSSLGSSDLRRRTMTASRGVLASTCRGTVMSLVHDQHVVAAGVDGFALGGQRLPKQPLGPLSLEEVDRGDQPREMTPRVDVDAPLAPEVAHQFAIDDAEVEPELIPHLVPPLNLERGRADDQNSPGPVPDDQFEGHQARLDGLAEAHVVGDQEVDPWHLGGRKGPPTFPWCQKVGGPSDLQKMRNAERGRGKGGWQMADGRWQMPAGGGHRPD